MVTTDDGMVILDTKPQVTMSREAYEALDRIGASSNGSVQTDIHNVQMSGLTGSGLLSELMFAAADDDLTEAFREYVAVIVEAAGVTRPSVAPIQEVRKP